MIFWNYQIFFLRPPFYSEIMILLLWSYRIASRVGFLYNNSAKAYSKVMCSSKIFGKYQILFQISSIYSKKGPITYSNLHIIDFFLRNYRQILLQIKEYIWFHFSYTNKHNSKYFDTSSKLTCLHQPLFLQKFNVLQAE